MRKASTAVLLWRCTLTASALNRVKRALQLYHLPIHEASVEVFTVRLYARAAAEDGGEGETLDSRGIVFAHSLTEPERCMIQDYKASGPERYIVSAEMETLLARVHGGTLRLRQEIVFNLQRVKSERRGEFLAGTVGMGKATIGVVVLHWGGGGGGRGGEELEGCSMLESIFPRKLFPELLPLDISPVETDLPLELLVRVAKLLL